MCIHSRRRLHLKYLDLQICRFSWPLFWVTGTPFTHVIPSSKNWGLPRKLVSHVRGLPWKLVGIFESRNCLKSDLLRLWMCWCAIVSYHLSRSIMYICTYSCVYMHIFMCIFVHIHAYMHIFTCIYAHIHVFMCWCANISDHLSRWIISLAKENGKERLDRRSGRKMTLKKSTLQKFWKVRSAVI